jgi:hypothetical protein
MVNQRSWRRTLSTARSLVPALSAKAMMFDASSFLARKAPRPMPMFCGALAVWLGLAVVLLAGGENTTRHILKAGISHLGLAGDPEWQDFEGRAPDSSSLEIQFTSSANGHEATLLIRQREVSLKWPVLLNGQKLGDLDLSETPTVHVLTVPTGALHDGKNTLEIRSPEKPDDIFIDEILLDDRSPAEVLHEAQASVRVTEKGTGGVPIPCRLTIVDARGFLTPLSKKSGAPLATRVLSTPGMGTRSLDCPQATTPCMSPGASSMD